MVRSGQGLQFTDAFALTVNGKDKALALGSQPRLAGPIGKLPSTRLNGALVKDGPAGVIALYTPGDVVYLLPEGLPKNAPGDPAAIWRTVRISYRKSASDKTPGDVPVEGFLAFLPGGPEELTRLCMDEGALELIGGKGAAFATQIEWLGAVAKSYSSNPDMGPLEKYVEDAMRQRYEQFESGTAGVDVLAQGLKLAELSQAVYPNQAPQAALRKSLTERKAWLDRKTAVLRAFAAAQEWDMFLLADRDFEKYQRAYPDLMGRHTEALQRSFELHQKAGDERKSEGEFRSAFREFRVASLRQPSDKLVEQQVSMAWENYSRQTAIDRQQARRRLNAGQQREIDRALLFATRYKEDNKLDEAMRSVRDAENVDREYLPVLLKKAEILGAQKRFSDALATLDEYDLRAVDEERKKAADLRSDLEFRRTSSVQEAKTQVRAAWSASSFHKAFDLAWQGLEAKDDEADLLYYAGMAALITRQPKIARNTFSRYLAFSNTLEADQKQRAEVRTVLATIGDSPAPDRGDANWLSAKKLPKGVFYCPVSLAFQPRVEHIEASNKLRVTYEWDGERLRSITPAFEKSEHVTGEKKISFAYDDRGGVVSVSDDNAPRVPSASDPDERVRQSSVVLGNNPYVDPAAIQKLAGNNITLGIAGNRFFHPFVWDGIHYFKLTYDDQGRVRQAREIAYPKAPPGGLLVEFEWTGWQLTAVRGYEGRVKIYDRTLQYQDGRLIGEEIAGQGKSSHIKYNYTGNRLVSAECSSDTTLDGRSRKVLFVANSPTVVVN